MYGEVLFSGGNSYTKGSHMIRGRKASVLVLECFLLMRIDRVEIEKEVKEEAEKAALAWRKRLIAQGGVAKAYEMDARGLLLLIGCFGIPGGFRNEVIKDLLQISHISKISRALRRSNVLMAKIPEIIEGMVKQNMEVDAVHIAYTFGIEDRFNPRRLLTSFLLNSRESLKKRKEESQGSLAAVQRVDAHVDINNTLPEDRTTGHLHGYTVSSSVLRGPSAGLIHENVAGSLVGTGRGVAMGVAGAGISASADGIHAGISAGTDVVQQGSPYSGGHGGTLVDSTPGQIGSHTGRLYGRRGDAAVYDRLALCSYAYRPSSYLEGSKGFPNIMYSDVYRPSPYLKGFTGLPNAISGDAAGRSSASDIYQAAGTVLASELYLSSGLQAVDTVSSAASAHPSSNLYRPR